MTLPTRAILPNTPIAGFFAAGELGRWATEFHSGYTSFVLLRLGRD
jgi:small ligand-binding sensory domain FIST